MAEVMARPPRRRTDGCGEAGGRPREPSVRGSRGSEPLSLTYAEMKKKVVGAGRLRLSPNEEACVLKEDYERRRKLRLLQVREQERDIAFQIREDIKQRRNQQFTRLAEELKTEWEESQNQKIKNLEKLYLASLRTMGEGHQQAKENEPDLNAVEQLAAERKRKAEMRHKEALKVQKNQKETLMKQKTWHIKARKEALLMEKERSAKITSLPPPPPALFENIEVDRPSVKTTGATYHHLHALVDRETDSTQPDPHVAAEEETKRLEGLQKQAAQERTEQCEKAQRRGSQAMRKIHLAQSQEKLMKELKQLQQEDLARRRQMVAQMPPQLAELPYRRSEMREEWQRELEFAFEDMYNADRMVKGNLILHLEPEPLPTLEGQGQGQDAELDLSVEQEHSGEVESLPMAEADEICSSEKEASLAMKTHEIPSKALFRKLLNKIRSQKSLWTIKSMSEDESGMTTLSDSESKVPATEWASASEEEPLSSGPTQGDSLTVDSGPLTSEDRQLSQDTDAEKEREMQEAPSVPTVTQSSVLLHPQETAARIRIAARQKQIMEIEEQKQKQLKLLEQIEQQKLRLENDCFRAQLEEAKRKKTQQTGVDATPASFGLVTDEDRQMIWSYQHHLLQQNRLHRQSVEIARQRLLEYQNLLKGQRAHVPRPATPVLHGTVSAPPPEQATVASELWNQGQRQRLGSNKYQPMQVSKLEADYFQVPGQNHFVQRQADTSEASLTPDARQASCKSSLQPLPAEHSLGSVTAKSESGKTQEPLGTMSKSTASVPHSVFSPMQDERLPPSEYLTAQQGRLKALQKQLDLQKEVLRSRQEAQERLLLCKQKELEGRTGLSISLPLDLFASLPTAQGRVQESSPTRKHPVTSFGRLGVPLLQEKLSSLSQSVSSQRENFKLLQEQLHAQRDSLQALREAQKVLCVHKQREPGGRGQSPPAQGTQQTSALWPSADRQSGNVQEQCQSDSENGLPSSQPEIPRPQDGTLSFLQQFLPLHNSLKLLQEQLATQRDALQAHHEAQVQLLSRGRWAPGDGKSGQVSTSFPLRATQHPLASQTSAGTEPGRFQSHSLSEESTIPSSLPAIPTPQDKPLSCSQCENLPTLQGQLQLERGVPAGRETGGSVHRPGELERQLSSEETDPLSSLSQGVGFQESMPAESDSSVPLSHSKTPGFQECLQVSQHHFRLPDSLKAAHEWRGTEETPTDSSLLPQLTQPSSSLLSASSAVTQEPLSTERDSTVPPCPLQDPHLQDRLSRVSHLSLPQRNNLQEHLAVQREALGQPKQDTQQELLSQKDPAPLEQGSTTTTFSLVAEQSFASLPLAEAERVQEADPARGEATAPCGHSVLPPRSADTLLGASQSDHASAPSRLGSLPSSQKSQQEVPFPGSQRFEDLFSPEHLLPSHHGVLKAIQQHLDTQRKTIRCRQEAQEQVLLQRLSMLQERVSEPTGSSCSLSQPATDSGRSPKSSPATSHNTALSSQLEAPRPQDRLLELSQPILPRQEHLGSGDKSQEEPLLSRQGQETKSDSSEHTLPSSLLPKERECSFSPLPFAQVQPANTCRPHLSFSHPVLAQQDNVGLQKQLALQREVLHYRQRAQEDLLVQRQAALQKQIQKHQETLKDFFKDSQTSKLTLESHFKTLKLSEWLPHLQDCTGADEGNASSADQSSSEDQWRFSEDNASLIAERLEKAAGDRPSKPPVARVKCGLDLIQHELSAIQEVESPASGQTATPGKPDFDQDRDPLRVSISREQSFFLGSPVKGGLFDPEPAAQEKVCSDDTDVAVKVKKFAENPTVFTYTEEEEQDCLGTPVLSEEKAETQETYHEPLSSVTVSTGSFLSYENTDLSLTDPESLSEGVDPQQLESLAGKAQEAGSLGSAGPSQAAYPTQGSPDVHSLLLPAGERRSSGLPHRSEADLMTERTDLQVYFDFPELEYIFPNLHHQLFKPLEPLPDFDVSSFSSGTSQDSRDFCQPLPASQQSSKSLYDSHARSTVWTSPDLVQTAAQHSATETTREGSEQSFQQLLPELASLERNQHADLPNSISFEARVSLQGLDSQCYSSEQMALLQTKKKSVHFQLPVDLPSSSLLEDVFNQLSLQHSTPCDSTVSTGSLRTHSADQRQRLDFEEQVVAAVLQSQSLIEDKYGTYRVMDMDLHVPEGAVETSLPAKHSEEHSDFSTKTEAPEATQRSQSELSVSSGSLSLQSSIPVWETESGLGILEEPELTLVSISDVSVTEMELSNLTLEDKRDSEGHSCFLMCGTPPLKSGRGTDFPAASVQKPPTEILPMKGSLQEAFVKKKKTFIERSSQRQKEIWNKFHSESKALEKPAGSMSRIKRVHKVKTSLPEDRKHASSLTYQRAQRLYDQLPEEMQQKEKKVKRDIYAQNRARAKEFHKKTLERLRAKNIR